MNIVEGIVAIFIALIILVAGFCAGYNAGGIHIMNEMESVIDEYKELIDELARNGGKIE